MNFEVEMARLPAAPAARRDTCRGVTSPEASMAHLAAVPAPTADCKRNTPCDCTCGRPPNQRSVVRPCRSSDNRIMVFRTYRILLIELLCLLIAATSLWAVKDFVMPHAENAATYPSKD